MGAAGLIAIKRRIKSVESTRKITNAMGLVATSKLRKARKELSVNIDFTESMGKVVKKIAKALESNTEDIYLKGNKSNNKLYIIITSESGLCGGYNGNIVSFLKSEISEDDMDNTKVIVIGKRGIGYVKRAGFETVKEYVDISDIPTVKEMKVVFTDALNMYKDEEVSEINLVYTEFISPVKQEPKTLKILPISLDDDDKEYNENIIIEPNLEEAVSVSLELYLKGKMRDALLSAKCSEQSSRMTAMDGATNNANDLLSNLNLKYNRIRQGMITQEISEIVGGAEAQK
ncbi:ATP synthase F1 subunit gamma [Clostridium sp. BJN0001]|uniref:ATP synthase F1 subunit gamma n=1 Tax=Clostridium sp. BJN0001 TaxID=2930219 RepID=UPI001FD1C3BD|nr:ATP synthase F1 subunit gamma [Clostridium sp. BJN0001]